MPMISPVLFYTLILGVVEVLQYFLVPLVLKNGTGEPGGTTLFFNLYLYKKFFTFQNMSYGATLAWLLFGITPGHHARAVPALAALGLLRGRRVGWHERDAQSAHRQEVTVAQTERRNPRRRGDRAERSFLITLIAVCAVAAFLSPLLRSVSLSLKSAEQISQPGAPLLPGRPGHVRVPGRGARLFHRADRRRDARAGAGQAGPAAEHVRRPGRTRRAADHLGGLVADASSRSGCSRRTGRTTPTSGTSSTTRGCSSTRSRSRSSGRSGRCCSCTLVAYGFARFRFPGRNLLFTLLIATIFLPAAVTLIPTYTLFVKLGWVGTWLPLLVPAFFANAYDVFLLRQYFMTIPRELDEAAAIDGAGPLRILRSVILPQAWPVIVAVAIFHFVYSWNDFFGPLIYLSTKPDLQPLAVGLARFNGTPLQGPGLIQAGTLMTLVIPVVAVPRFPALLHPRHRHHRGREVTRG